MKIVEPSIEIYRDKAGSAILESIESAGRTCYKSESKITSKSSRKFVAMILKRGHLSVIEHEKVTARVICDRGVTHEIVRHRLGSYSQESTRYVNYEGKDMEFINPCFWQSDSKKDTINNVLWYQTMRNAEISYNKMIKRGAIPQEARSILPNSLKTEIVITYNLREWKHFFELRCAKAAHPQMREVAKMLLKQMTDYIPVIFDDQKEKFLNE